MVVLVTGAGGQLGQAIQHIAGQHPEITFVFCTFDLLSFLIIVITSKKLILIECSYACKNQFSGYG